MGMGMGMSILLWAQAAPTTVQGSQPNVEVAVLTLRRWFTSLTLGPPDGTPLTLSELKVWLLSWAALVVVVILVQGPRQALRQLFEIRGHFALLNAAGKRLRSAGRLIAVTVGVTVWTWTASQSWFYRSPQGRDDLQDLLRGRGVWELSLEHGVLAGLTPLRDVFGLADHLLLLGLAGLATFQVAMAHWSGVAAIGSNTPQRQAPAFWTLVAWISAWAFAMYQCLLMLAATSDFPLGGLGALECVLIPMMIWLADGVMAAWVLSELRQARLGTDTLDAFDPSAAVSLLPAALGACLLLMPGRYLATGMLLALPYAPGLLSGIELTWWIVLAQGCGVALLGLAGAAAWSRGGFRGALEVFWALLRRQGARLAVSILALSLGTVAVTVPAYAILLALPPQSWVLSAADSYAHYGTLFVSLLGLSALVELGQRVLPEARVRLTEPVIADSID